jgi:acyl phosphate:glycerol-3-phosphate acyltransferase
MNDLAAWLIAPLGGYLLGSLPTGYLVGRSLRGIDIREHGSGSTGATNVLRTLGKGPGLFTFAIDILKGSLAVALTQNWLAAGLDPQTAAWLAAIAGMMAILGHSKPVWLGWKGGKSVATGLGLLLAMNLPVGLAGFGFFLLTLALFQIVSLGSIVAAASVIVMMLLSSPYLAYKLFAVLACGFIIWRHRSNIDRLRQGKEPKIGQKLNA